MEHKEKKLFGKLNIIDALVIVLLVAALAFVGYKLATRGVGGGGDGGRATLTYTVECEGVLASLYEETQKYIPSQVMASGALMDANIVAVEKEPFYVLAGNGEWVEDPDHVNLIFTIEGTVANNAVLTSEIGSQEIRVGKKDHIVKSEFIEVGSGVITSATWERPE